MANGSDAILLTKSFTSCTQFQRNPKVNMIPMRILTYLAFQDESCYLLEIKKLVNILKDRGLLDKIFGRVIEDMSGQMQKEPWKIADTIM